ncbi:MAG: hypothetical protein ACREJ0_03320 [Geminicoccaceae bacterium]
MTRTSSTPSTTRTALAWCPGTSRAPRRSTSLIGRGGWVNALAFDPSGKRLASAAADGTARIWRVFQERGSREVETEVKP